MGENDQRPPSPLALSRSRRANAGAKMNQLINDDDKDKGDEFYSTTYGGFAEEEDDQDYEAKSDDNDEVDTDFDVEISEDEEGKEGEGEEGGQKKKKKERDEEYDEDEEERRKKRKALKRKRLSVPPESKNEVKKSKKFQRQPNEESNDGVADSLVTEEPAAPAGQASTTSMKRSALRTSTQIKSEMGEARRKVERAIWSKKKEARDKTRQYRAQFRRRLTQAELFEEAKITERLNVESLERFRQFEELKKAAQRVVKQRKIQSHLCIRYSSITADNQGDKTSHNFVSFGDKKMFDEVFRPHTRKQFSVARKICPLTGQPAKYFDPVTKLPYANLQAFRMLRQIHADAVMKEQQSSSH